MFEAFRFYMERESHSISQKDFLANLENKKTDLDFSSDIWPIKSESVDYNFEEAFALVCGYIKKYL